MIDNLKMYNESLKLQKCFEDGIIKEEELSEEQKNSLIKLYRKQIEKLQNDIDNNKKVFKEYKQKILEIRNKKC